MLPKMPEWFARATGANCVMPEMTGQFCDHVSGMNYYGGFLLSFAVVHASVDIVEFLITHKAPLDRVDEWGNSAVHMCVKYNRLFMLRHLASSMPDKVAELLKRTNRDKLTPLTYAVQCDRPEMFGQVLELQGRVLWRYGPVTCKQYPMRELDSLCRGPSGDRSHSVLHLIARAGKAEVLHPIVAQLIQDKWKSYGKALYTGWLTMYLVHQVLLLLANLDEIVPRVTPLVSVCVLMFFEVYEVRLAIRRQDGHVRQGLASYLMEVENWLTLIQFGLIIPGWVIERPALAPLVSAKVGSLLYGLSALVGWIQILQTLRANKSLGVKVIVMRNVAVDFAKWGVFWAIITVGFSMLLRQCFATSEKDDAMNEGALVVGLLVRPLFGEFRSEPEFDRTTYPGFTRVVYYFYQFVIQIGMLNTLIAMLSRTFSEVESKAHHVWIIERVRTILMLEKSALGFFIGPRYRYQAPWHKCPHIVPDPDAEAKENTAKDVLLRALGARSRSSALPGSAANMTDAQEVECWQGPATRPLSSLSLEQVAKMVSSNADGLAGLPDCVKAAWWLAVTGPELFIVLERESEPSSSDRRHRDLARRHEPIPSVAAALPARRTLMSDRPGRSDVDAPTHSSATVEDEIDRHARARGRIEMNDDELALVRSLLRKLSHGRSESPSTEDRRIGVTGPEGGGRSGGTLPVQLDGIALELDGGVRD
jgi:hypothetical protein